MNPATSQAESESDSPTIAALKEVRARIERAESCCRSAAREYEQLARNAGIGLDIHKAHRLYRRADIEVKRAEVELDLKGCLDLLIAREP